MNQWERFVTQNRSVMITATATFTVVVVNHCILRVVFVLYEIKVKQNGVIKYADFGGGGCGGLGGRGLAELYGVDISWHT